MYAELIAFLELTPWEGAPYREDKPEGSMRTMPFGKRAEGMAVYVILEEQRRVVVVSATWLELSSSVGLHYSRAAVVGPHRPLPSPLTSTSRQAVSRFSILLVIGEPRGPSSKGHSQDVPPRASSIDCDCHGMLPLLRPDDREKSGKGGAGGKSAEVIG